MGSVALSHVILDMNKPDRAILLSDSLVGLPSLISLSFEACTLDAANVVTNSYPQLESLSIRSNSIRSLDFLRQVQLRSLTSLDASGNILRVISTLVFANATGLTSLHLDQNNIGALDANAFHGLSQLQEFSMRKNRLTMLDSQLSSLLALKTLDLDGNSLSQMTLDRLVLANQFRAIPPMDGFPTLKYLDLSHNGISALNVTTFLACKSLYLTCNQQQAKCLASTLQFASQFTCPSSE